MIDIIITVVFEVAKCLAPPLARRFDHLRNYKTNFEKLDQQVRELKLAKDRMQREVDYAVKEVEEIKPEVKEWQINVDSIIDEADKLIEENANNRCFKGLCPNLMTRHKNSKQASRELEFIARLLQKEERFDEVSCPITLEDIRLTSKDFEAFESRDETLKNIIKALNDASVQMVGVYGMGGIGKTTLVKEAGRQAKNDKLFDEVVFVEISENQDIEKIQKEIAGWLRIKDFNNAATVSLRATLLHAHLKNEGKTLIILDNIWNELPLETVGIPSGPDHGGCKVLLTSRDQEVLAIMGSKTFPIGSLDNEEAWRLFKKMARDYVENQELKSVATDVVKECGGLPVAIVTVAKALRNREKFEWDDALEELRRPSPSNITALLKPAYSKIEFSYNKLKGDELKKSFLLCSLMTNNASISDLFNYIVGLGMLDGNTHEMEKARNRLRKWVRQLKDSCLLLGGDYDSSQCFSMHDVVRDVAVSIASRNDCFREWPDKDKLKQCMRISIHGSNISEPLEGLECPKLEFFYMNTTNSSLEITESSFMDMPKLRVLDLPAIKSLSLPSSLCHLVNLQTLCLQYGRFKDVAIIGELKKLKILSLEGSALRRLPNEIGQLTQLRLLNLNYCQQLEAIAPTVISKLLQLEELYMERCPVQWEVEGLHLERSNASLEELKHLSRLTTIEISIRDDTTLPKRCFFPKMLERYTITIGDYWWPYDKEHVSSRTLRINLESSIYLEEYLQVVKNVEVLYVRQMQGAKNVFCELEREGFSQLKHLRIWDNNQFVCIVDLTDTVCRDAFPLLESLSLVNLNNLENICSGRLITTQLFNKLKSIRVKGCDKLKKIFPMSILLTCLQQFQRIEVDSCENMEEIFAVEGEDGVDNEIEFSQLRSLTLSSLPRLRTFYSGMSGNTQTKLTSAQEPSSEIVPENELNIPTSVLFNDKVVFPKLEVLELRNVSVAKIWDSQLPTMLSSYKNLMRLIMKNCQKLEYLFSSSMAKSLEQLQHLEISECNDLKEIVGDGGGAEVASCEFVFQRVTFLKLWHLPKLVAFYNGVHTSEWPMLKQLEIGYCNKVNVFNYENREENHFDVSRLQPLFLAQKVVSPKPEVLKLMNVNVEKIWDSQLPIMSSSYKNLTSLIMKNCQKLEYLFSSSMVKSLEQLQYLEISECNVLKEIVKDEGGAETTSCEFVFPRVTFLKLCHLPELATFYNGVHTCGWPMLKQLEIGYCDKVNIFTFENNEESYFGASRPQSLFLPQKVNPNLEKLNLEGLNIILMWLPQLLENHFPKLEVTVRNDKSTNIPLGILKNLKRLCLDHCWYKEIFSCGENEIFDGTPLRIKVLEISWLYELRNTWKQDSKLDSILQNLEILRVKGCIILMNVVPSSASFQNLTTLEVSYCSGLINLITSSTAKSLEQLREMKIESCHLLIEVVADKDEVKGEIVFNKLKLLSLEYLESLISFCSGNHTFIFPSLEELIVVGCPNMKNFSGGVLSAPKLQEVKLSQWTMQWSWEGDLNTTIQELHKTEVSSNLKKLRLSGDDIRLAWQGQLKIEVIKILEVIKDESTNIPLRILEGFSNLEELILKLSSYEEMFSSEMAQIHGGTVTQIKTLKLLGLFDLKQLWKQDSQLDSVLRNLEKWCVKHCHSLFKLAPNSASFENLTTLEVSCCDGLRNLVTSSTAKSLGRLESLTISNCEMMIEIVENGEDEAREDEIVFNNLKRLFLSRLESLSSFSSGNYCFNFPALEEVTVIRCPNMEVFCKGVLSTPKLQKVGHWSNNWKTYWEGDLNTTLQQLYKINK